MPRIARIKNDSSSYHIMVRGGSETPLFRNDEDKEKYLKIIKKYQPIYMFKLYAYCFMTTHAHFILDPLGADISKIMHSINLSYAIYFNRRYDRHGHVFQDRFKSKIISSQKYLLVLSAYIHNNVKDMKEYQNNIEKYKYSSLGVYLNIHDDAYAILDTTYILQQFGNTKLKSLERYVEFISRYSENNNSSFGDEYEFKNDGTEYRSERVILTRNYSPEKIIAFISNYIGVPFSINIKYNHKNLEFKALSVVIMRSLCNYKLKEIGAVIGNVTLSNVCQLSEKGLKLITQDARYKEIINELIKFSTAE
jgi:putative transposase